MSTRSLLKWILGEGIIGKGWETSGKPGESKHGPWAGGSRELRPGLAHSDSISSLRPLTFPELTAFEKTGGCLTRRAYFFCEIGIGMAL